MKRIIIIILVFTPLFLQAQKEATWWYFGHNAGLDFTNVINGTMLTPDPLSNGPIYTGEGCFSISDIDGNFILASDGINVYNKNRLPVEDGSGLFGHPSATQSGIFIPRPEMQNQYYIVTTSAREGDYNGINYSIVDLSLNNGDGKVIEKNIPLNLGAGHDRRDSYENIMCVKHANRKDYWLVNRSRDKFFTWLVTKDGITVDPVMICDIGVDLGEVINNNRTQNAPGYIKIASNGKYVAHVGHASRYLTFGEFNNNTGEVSNLKILQLPKNYFHEVSPNNYFAYLYSVEFSQTCNYLYLAGLDGLAYVVPTNNITLPAVIPVGAGSVTEGERIGTMQMGPDGKIYAVSNNSSNLYVIEDPDEGGSKLAIHPNFFSIPMSSRGLPNFPTSFFELDNISGSTAVCINNEQTYSVSITQTDGINKIASITWDFGDGTTVSKNISDTEIIHTQKHVYKKRGTYEISITPYNASGVPFLSKVVTLENVRVGACVIPINPNLRVRF